MSARLAAASALLCTLFGAGRVRAEDPAGEPFPTRSQARPVAVIELSDTEPGRLLARAIHDSLNERDDLKQLDLAVQPALIDAITDLEAQRLDDARKLKQGAEDDLSSYKFPDAGTKAEQGQMKLHLVAPTPAVTALYAELSFVLGAARLGERKNAEAQGQFRLAHLINPAFKPDAIRYLPEVVQAYEVAIKAKVPPGMVAVSGTGKVVLDGREVGELFGSSQRVDSIAGPHVVWLVGSDREPRGDQKLVEPNRKTEFVIDDAKFGPAKKLQQLKVALKQAPDGAARAVAMQSLARELQVGDAVLVSGANGKLIVQTWRDRAPGFSALREYRETDKPADVLDPLGRPKRIVIQPPKPTCPAGFDLVGTACIKRKQPIDERAWWRKPKYQITGGVAAAVVLGVVIYGLSTWDRSLKSNPMAGFETGRQ
jgi:hypothetical protein